jgi:hypothetical protein
MSWKAARLTLEFSKPLYSEKLDHRASVLPTISALDGVDIRRSDASQLTTHHQRATRHHTIDV